MENQQSGGPGLLTRGLTYVVATLSILWQKATHDGTLAAAGRQGLDELGAALKAFPETIQMQEPGTIFHPTQGEIAADRKESPFWPGHHSPSGIVANHARDDGPQQEQQQEPNTVRSPSEIVDGLRAQVFPENGFVAAEMARRQNPNENDSYEKARERSLPDEQREQGRER